MDYEGYLYRAIHPFSVIEEGSLAERDIEAVTEYDMAAFDNYYEPDHICRLPAPNGKGADRIFMVFPHEFGIGGQDHPYSGSVPACDDSETLFRAAAAVPAGKEYSMLLPLHEKALISPDWVPITDDNVGEIEKYLSSVGLEGICQKRISEDPERYGIFFVEKDDAGTKSDPYERISDEANSNDIYLQIATYAKTVESMPRALRSCSMPAMDYLRMTVWGESIRELQLLASELSGGFYIVDALAPELAYELIEGADLFGIGEPEIDTLKRIVSFGIEGGLCEAEISEIASRLARTYSDSKEVIYGLFAVTSLRIAKGLHSESGGISEDFVDFSESVEGAIIDGRIRIRIQSMRDIMRSPSAFAVYLPLQNEIVFPPLDSGASPELYFGTIVHECYHAYQDMNELSATVLEMERAAHSRGTRAEILLKAAGITGSNPISELAAQESTEYADALAELTRSAAKCQGTPDELLELYSDFKTLSMEAYANWEYAVRANLLEGADLDEDGLFEEFYRFANYEVVAGRESSMALLSVGYDYDQCVDAYGEDFCNSKFLPDPEDYNTDYLVFPATADGARKALEALRYQAHLFASAFYADRELWKEIALIEDLDRESVMDALLQKKSQYDGI